MRMLRLVGFGLLVLVLVGGCSGQPTGKSSTDAPAARTAGPSRGVIAVSLLTLENPFFRVIGDSITAAAKEHGYDTLVLSADQDPAKQSNQVKDFIVKKAVAIVLSPCESRAIVPVIQEANEAGIPVFTVDIPCLEEGVKIVSQITTDNEGGGREAGQAMIEALGESGGKVVILNFEKAESCRLRVKGFRRVLDDYNGSAAKPIEIVAELEGGGKKDVGFRAAEDALQAHPELRGIFAINDPSALGARAALEKAGKERDITIVGFDGQPEGKQAIKAGKIYADPIQFPEKMGVEAVKAIVAYYQGEDVEPVQLIPTRLYRKADADADRSLP